MLIWGNTLGIADTLRHAIIYLDALLGFIISAYINMPFIERNKERDREKKKRKKRETS